MADSTWVRLFAGQRSRTPTRSSPPALPSPTALLLDNSYFGGEKPPDAKPGTVRTLAPGLLSSAPSGPGIGPAVTGQDLLLINDEDQVQQNPQVDEMAEALRIAIMTRPAVATLGPEFTSYVLHLVEGYAGVKKKLAETEALFDEAIALRKRESDAFTLLAERWDEQEMQYRAEIKRLELFIHDTSEKGVAAVLLARAGSKLRKKQLGGNMEEVLPESGNPEEQRAGQDGAIDRDADGMLIDAQGADQYSILTRRRNLDPRLDFEISERIRRLCASSPADGDHLHHHHQYRIPDAQHPPAQTIPRPPRQPHPSAAPSQAPSIPFSCLSLSSCSSSSSSSSASEAGDDAGPAARYVTPFSPDTDDTPPDLPPKKPPHAPVSLAPSPDLDGETLRGTYSSPSEYQHQHGPRAHLFTPTSGQPPSSSSSSSCPARTRLHRRQFSFAPGDDILGLVRLRSPTASASDEEAEEGARDPVVVPSVERKPGNSNSL